MRIPLHDTHWRLARAEPIPTDGPLDDPAALTDWLSARVPGSIQRDLMAAGRLPDLEHLLDLQEALAWVDGSDWWLQRELPAIEPRQRAWIDFSGIDYFAAVTLNGQELERRAGMYSPRRYEITEGLRNGPAMLGVRIWGAWALPTWPRTRLFRLKKWLASKVQRGGLEPFSDRLLTLKAPVHFGWDFAPRLLAAGVWDDVHLHVSGRAAITGMWARADWGPKFGLMVRLELDSAREEPLRLRFDLISLTAEAPPQRAEFHFRARAGRSTRHVCWPDVRLNPWTTHDRGVPHRYRLIATLMDASGQVTDARAQVIGSRRFGWRIDRGVHYPLLNDEPIRFRGVNWVPLDLLPGDEDEEMRYRKLLQAAVDAGVNAIRVWGGGGRERPIFYDLCDELGLLVWQEMPIACVFLDALPEDDGFIKLVRQETRGIIRALRGHPSVIMWGGGNEWGPDRFKGVAQAMGETAAREDPSRRWLPASPGPHDSHNWLVWHEKASPAAYARDPAPLLSEFGLAAPPDVGTLRAMLPPDGVWPPGEGWRARKAEIGTLQHYARFFIPDQEGQESSARDPLQSFVHASQEAQARGLQQGMEAYRLREDAAGTFLWQWNEPWPAISWSVWPHRGPSKRAFGQIARSYAPLAPLARIHADRIELWVVNDGPRACQACILTAKLDGRVLWSGQASARPGERVLIQTLPLPSTPGRFTLRLRGDGVNAVNDYPLPWPFPPAKRLRPRAWLASLVMRWLLRW
ncbi:MAG TPA: hypothetical protein G4O05_04635 [Caldilineae bacterium]|nr:hypothetical protein [Caldilineae bacterium]